MLFRSDKQQGELIAEGAQGKVIKLTLGNSQVPSPAYARTAQHMPAAHCMQSRANRNAAREEEALLSGAGHVLLRVPRLPECARAHARARSWPWP